MKGHGGRDWPEIVTVRPAIARATGNPASQGECESDISLACLAGHPLQLSIVSPPPPPSPPPSLPPSLSLSLLIGILAPSHTHIFQADVLLSEKSLQIKQSRSKVLVSSAPRCHTRRFVTVCVGSGSLTPFFFPPACDWPQDI